MPLMPPNSSRNANPPVALDLTRRQDADPGLPAPVADAPLTPAEAAQVDQAVRTVNAILLRKNLEIATELHSYVLAEFFGGDWQAFADCRPGNLPAFDAFATSPKLRVGRDMLRELLRVGEQVRHMPGALASELTVAHHRALLPVLDPDERTSLAALAVQKGLTAEELAAKVREAHPRPPRKAGRPAQLRTFKKLTATFKAGKQVDPVRLAAEVARYTPTQRQTAAERARALIAMAQAVLAALEGA